MLPELSLVKLFLVKDKYDSFRKFVELTDFPKELQSVVRCIDNHFKLEDDPKDLTIVDLANNFFSTRPKDRALYEGLFDTLNTVPDASEESCLRLLHSFHRAKLLRELSIASYEVSEGKREAKDVVELYGKLQQISEDNNPLSPNSTQEENFDFVSNDLELLVQGCFKEQGLRWRLNTLNRMLGSLRKGDFGFIFARPECFTPDTEVLTPTGWLSVDKVTLETPIGAVDKNLHLRFERPSLVTQREDFKTIWNIFNKKGQVNLSVSSGHRMVYTKNNEWQENLAKDISYVQGMKTHTTSKGIGILNELTPLDQLHIAFQADGRTRRYDTHRYSTHKYGYEILLKKPRKIQRLEEILNQLEKVSYSTWIDSKGYTGFYITTDALLTKDFSTISLEDKGFVWCQQFAEELKYWDGSSRSSTRWKYSNTNKEAIDKAQAIVALSGYNSFLSTVKDKRGYSTCYELHIRSNYTPVDGQGIIKEEVPNTQTLYCFTVSTGMLLVRRKGVVAVCGNTGKTTLLASEGTYMAQQAKKRNLGPVLWLNNEEQGDKVMLRCYQACLGVTVDSLLENLKGHKETYSNIIGEHLKLYDNATITKTQVEKLVDKYQPSLVIFDQIDKIQGFESDREDLRLGSIYQWAREIAKKYCPVIAVCQADGTGEGQRWLTMANVANAKTSKQAEADWILGVGKVNDPGYDTLRYLHLSKNKLLGDEDSDHALRHGRMECLIEPEVARYKDIMV